MTILALRRPCVAALDAVPEQSRLIKLRRKDALHAPFEDTGAVSWNRASVLESRDSRSLRYLHALFHDTSQVSPSEPEIRECIVLIERHRLHLSQAAREGSDGPRVFSGLCFYACLRLTTL